MNDYTKLSDAELAAELSDRSAQLSGSETLDLSLLLDAARQRIERLAKLDLTTTIYSVATVAVSQAMLLAFIAILIEDNREFHLNSSYMRVRVPIDRMHQRRFERRCLEFGMVFTDLKTSRFPLTGYPLK